VKPKLFDLLQYDLELRPTGLVLGRDHDVLTPLVGEFGR